MEETCRGHLVPHQHCFNDFHEMIISPGLTPQNHEMGQVGPQSSPCSSPPAMSRDTFHQSRFFQAPSSPGTPGALKTLQMFVVSTHQSPARSSALSLVLQALSQARSCPPGHSLGLTDVLE